LIELKKYSIEIKGNIWTKELIVNICKEKRLFKYNVTELLSGLKYCIQLNDLNFWNYHYFKKLKKIEEKK
jgi:hypothetical protein